MSFLKAEWRKLAIANYEVSPSLLKKYLPYKTELDFWNETCYVSLVGFMFLNTKLLGIKIPFHTNFEEVNLRFYVRYKETNEWKRGVVFIKEIVPKPALTIVANTVYGEHYQTMKMKHKWEESETERLVEYQWKCKNTWQTFRVSADINPSKISKRSEAEFITEHYWGYTKINEQKTFEYEVTHPKWEHYIVNNYQIDVDFKLNYGEEFEILNQAIPKSVMLAEGSTISVENKKEI